MKHHPRIPSEHPDDQVLARGRFVRLLRREDWEFIDQPGLRGLVVLAAVTPERRLLLVEQRRPPMDGRTLELPAGMVGDLPGQEQEAFESAAIRELEEETGWRAGRVTFLTTGPASPARTRYYYHFFRAYDLTRVHAGGGDASENITVHEAPLDGIDAWLAARTAEGLHVDPKIYVGLYFILRGGDV
jgi:ADP-ribose pyrophosphatase